MILVVILVAICLGFALFIYAVGAVLAILAEVFGDALGRKLPAWQRWGGAALLILLGGIFLNYELLPLNPFAAPSPNDKKGWSMIQFWSGFVANYLALGALVLTGVIASLRAPIAPPPIPPR